MYISQFKCKKLKEKYEKLQYNFFNSTHSPKCTCQNFKKLTKLGSAYLMSPAA